MTRVLCLAESKGEKVLKIGKTLGKDMNKKILSVFRFTVYPSNSCLMRDYARVINFCIIIIIKCHPNLIDHQTSRYTVVFYLFYKL